MDVEFEEIFLLEQVVIFLHKAYCNKVLTKTQEMQKHYILPFSPWRISATQI